MTHDCLPPLSAPKSNCRQLLNSQKECSCHLNQDWYYFDSIFFHTDKVASFFELWEGKGPNGWVHFSRIQIPAICPLAYFKLTLETHWKDWCWSWSSNILVTPCQQPTHWKRPWKWEKLKAKGEEGNRGWDGWHHQFSGHEFGQTPGDG